MSTVLFGLVCFTLPETSHDTILYWKAKRLRKRTGHNKYQSVAEIEQAKIKPRIFLKEALGRPFRLLLDPAVAYVNIYLGLAYAIFFCKPPSTSSFCPYNTC